MAKKDKNHRHRHRHRLAFIVVIVAVFLSLFHLIVEESSMERLALSRKGIYYGKDPHNTSAVDDNDAAAKHLQYAVEGGWANQVVCLKHAYELALATGRGLILSPVVPHFTFNNKNVLIPSTQEFKLNFDLQHAYLKQLRKKYYVPLGNVLDLDASLPGLVSKIDLREFYRQQWDGGAPWPMEYNVSHFNTHWIWNQSPLEGSQRKVRATEYGHLQTYHQTFRDVVRFSETPPFREYPIWTLLDSFKSRIHESVALHSHHEAASAFRPRFASTILAAGSAIRKDRWGSIPYASVHIRGGDGKFQRSKEIAIENALDSAGRILGEWIQNNRRPPNTPTSKTTNSVGLFVATDIPKIHKNFLFREMTSNLTQRLRDDHGIDLKVLFREGAPWYRCNKFAGLVFRSSSSSHRDDIDGCLPLEPEAKALFDRSRPDWVGYPGIFLDQQLAACAIIGFVGTNSSTFSKLIQELRTDNLEETCA